MDFKPEVSSRVIRLEDILERLLRTDRIVIPEEEKQQYLLLTIVSVTFSVYEVTFLKLVAYCSFIYC